VQQPRRNADGRSQEDIPLESTHVSDRLGVDRVREIVAVSISVFADTSVVKGVPMIYLSRLSLP